MSFFMPDQAQDCRFCGMGIEQDGNGRWRIVPLSPWPDPDALYRCGGTINYPAVHEPRRVSYGNDAIA